MGTAKDLKGFERKLITIIQHQNKRGKSPSLEEMELWLGRDGSEMKEVIRGLLKKRWLRINENKMIVLKDFSKYGKKINNQRV